MSNKIVLAAQNELIRKSVKQTEIALGTFGMFSCTTLIICNDAGYESLTHIDKYTDISFISDEINNISLEGIKLYIIRKKLIDEILNKGIEEAQLEITNNIISYVGENFPDISSSSIIEEPIEFADRYSDGVIFMNQNIYTTSNRAINIFSLIQEHKISVEEGLKLAKPYHVQQLHFLIGHFDYIDFGPKDFQIRIYTSAMFGFFRSNDSRKPDVVYSNKAWTTDFTELSDDDIITSYLDRLHQSKNNLIPEIKKIFFELTNTDLDSYSSYESETFRYKESLPEQLNNYWNYMSEYEKSSTEQSALDKHEEL